MTAAAGAPAAPTGEEGVVDIRDAAMLQQVTGCGLAAHKVAPKVRRVDVQNAQLTFWPPALGRFSGLTSINLAGNAITFIPQSIEALTGLQSLVMARNSLASVPPELGGLTALTELDLSGNQLRALPRTLGRLTGLQALNVMGNQLTALPEDFGGMTSLLRLGLKSNQLTQLPDSFCRLTRLVELFITDNQLTTLPAGFGELGCLVKLQASFNPFESLPDSLWRLPRLEMFRLAVGRLQQWPDGLAESGALPKLAWCSLGSNPAALPAQPLPESLPRVTLEQLQVGEKLGAGASGEVFTGMFDGKPAAIKVFSGTVSPDGCIADEQTISARVDHPHLTKVLALIVDPQQQQPAAAAGGAAAGGAAAGGDAAASSSGVIGLVLRLERGTPLAGRPSNRLLRNTWPEGQRFGSATVLKVGRGIASALAYLHSHGICHGDVYAHNILVDAGANAVLCDFGAAHRYDVAAAGAFWQAMEVRAYGLMMRDLVERLDGDAGSLRPALAALAAACCTEPPAARPAFGELEAQLASLLTERGLA